MKLTLTISVALLAIYVGSATAGTFEGDVTEISDGKTFNVVGNDKIEYRVRLSGIDAPEPGQSHWEESKHHLAHLVYHQRVHVEWKERDTEGRIVAMVRVNRLGGSALAGMIDCFQFAGGCNQDINLQMIGDGFAWYDRGHAYKLSGYAEHSYPEVEDLARKAKVGLWGIFAGGQ